MGKSSRKFVLAASVAGTLAVLGSGNVGAATTPPPSWKNPAKTAGNTYLGLSYNPAWHKIDSFTVGANDGSTAAIYPNLLDTRMPLSDSFNWQAPNPLIRFEDNTVWGFGSSFGYKNKAARLELEIGYERFETRETKLDENTGGSEHMYLLAKDLAHGVVSGKTEKLGEALADTAAQDIVTFAQTVGREARDIDKKVCKKKVASLSIYVWRLNGGMWSCNDQLKHAEDSHLSLSARFGKPHWHYPMQEDRGSYQTNSGWPGTAPGKINTAQGMAGDLVNNLDSKEKETIARIFTRNVTGAEVIELRAVTTTSVMFNACYDLQHKKLSPFGCLGFGANFISITDGHVAPKLAYKLKAGLSCEIAPRITAFVSGFYHRVLGAGEYYDVPVQHLLDDQSPEGRSKNYALAKFKLAYTGAEVGMRFAF